MNMCNWQWFCFIGRMEGEFGNFYERVEEFAVRRSYDSRGSFETCARCFESESHANRHRYVRTRKMSVLFGAVGYCSHNGRRKIYNS